MIAIILLVVLLLLLLGILSGTVSCPYQSQYGIACVSCGVSRDFMQYMQFNFSNPINSHSLSLFIFFVGQMGLRAIIGFSNTKTSKSIIAIDILISILWFGWVFGNMLL